MHDRENEPKWTKAELAEQDIAERRENANELAAKMARDKEESRKRRNGCVKGCVGTFCCIVFMYGILYLSAKMRKDM